MSRLLYILEDHFDALAESHKGHFSGWVSGWLGSLFAVVGDVLQANVLSRRV